VLPFLNPSSGEQLLLFWGVGQLTSSPSSVILLSSNELIPTEYHLSLVFIATKAKLFVMLLYGFI